MPTGAVLLLRLRQHPGSAAVDRWRRDLLTAFDTDEFSNFWQPLREIRSEAEGPMPVKDGSIWFNVGTLKDYYAEGNERGDAPYFVTLAEWLEKHVADGEVWYGNDCSDESIKPFGPREREAFLAYFRTVGHEPYNATRQVTAPKITNLLPPDPAARRPTGCGITAVCLLVL